jgi:putative ABC transport system permease protein
LNVVMLGLGFAAIVFIGLVSSQVEHQARRDLTGIDLVVGAPGSPLQLILASVFHLDVPAGNIPLDAVDRLRAQPLVSRVIPLSMGDSLQGFRIVGTEAGYVELYGAALAGGGRLWSVPMEAVLGAQAAQTTGLHEGDRFEGTHGLSAGGEVHGDQPYTVVGRLAPCGCVLDRLVLTSTESVWAVHEAAHVGDEPLDEADRQALEADGEVTALLVSYRSPLAAATLPRWVRAQPGLQAAAPALESARLLRAVGAGVEVLQGLGALLVAMAGLSLLVTMTHAVREREADLALLRLMGAPPRRLAALMAWEASWLAALAIVLGLALGHGLTHLLGWMLMTDRSLTLTGWWLTPWHGVWVVGALTVSWAAVAWPLWRVMRVDVTALLQGPR